MRGAVKLKVEASGLPVRAAEVVEDMEELEGLIFSEILTTDLISELLSSMQDDISQTEWRLMPVLPPEDVSMSYSTTGVSMGTL